MGHSACTGMPLFVGSCLYAGPVCNYLPSFSFDWPVSVEQHVWGDHVLTSSPLGGEMCESEFLAEASEAENEKN